MIPLLIVAVLMQEYKAVPTAVASLSSMGAVWVAASCAVGVGIGYTGIWVQSLISATSFLVLVNVNKFAIIFIEVALMKTKTLTLLQLAGCTTAIMGGVWYGKAKDNVDRASLEEREPI